MKDQEAADLIVRGKAFCVVPWVHFHIPASGPVVACCEAKGDLGSIDRDGFQGVWNGAQMRQFRLKMLADQPDRRCWKCHDVEASGGVSRRQHWNREYAHQAARVALTAPDGAITATPVSWDLRFSNLCNFRCRMCWHGSSSRWFDDARSMGSLAAPSALIRSVDDPRRFLAEVADDLIHLESILFAGGEPLMMEEHYLIVEALLARGVKNVRLVYNTNLSELVFKNTHVLDLWSQFENITVKASVDGTNARGELIRKGFDWQTFMQNVASVRQRCPHVNLECGITVAAFNALHLPELHRTLVEAGVIRPDQVRIHALQEPRHYSIRVLTAELKRAALDGLLTHRAWVARWYAAHPDVSAAMHEALLSQLSSIEAYLHTPDDELQRREFLRITRQLDELRSEKFFDVFPELAPLRGV